MNPNRRILLTLTVGIFALIGFGCADDQIDSTKELVKEQQTQIEQQKTQIEQQQREIGTVRSDQASPYTNIKGPAVSDVTDRPKAAFARAKKCYDDSVDTVSDDGDILKMISGSVWEVGAADQIESALWLTADDVLICSQVVELKGKSYRLYTIIDTDENGEKVDAERLR